MHPIATDITKTLTHYAQTESLKERFHSYSVWKNKLISVKLTNQFLGFVDHDSGGKNVIQHFFFLLLALDAHVLHRIRDKLCNTDLRKSIEMVNECGGLQELVT
jgi:hypothetical protein